MLLVTLMVLVTLGIAQRIRENHELNDLADAAAYSSAVANARAFNDIAILNRLEVSYWVSMAANESLISWTSYTRALWNATYRNLQNIRNSINPGLLPPAPCGQVRADADAASARVRTDFLAMLNGWQAADIAAGQETLAIQGAIGSLSMEARGDPSTSAFPDGMRQRLFDERKTQTIAKRIVTESGLAGVSVVPATGGALPAGGAPGVSSREVGDYGLGLYDDCSDTQSGLCVGATPGNWSDAVLEAAMGSRGASFTTSRGVTPPLIVAEWGALQAGLKSTLAFPGQGTPTGSAYWSMTESHSTRANNRFAWGDDHGSLTTTMSYLGCTRTQTQAARAHVRTTDLLDQSDQHDWAPSDIGANGDQPGIPEQFHTVGDCTPLCPSVWVRQVNFHPARDKPEDAYGQPKSVVLLVRDTSLADRLSQPWKLDFRFGFSAAGSRFDNRGETLHASSLGGVLGIISQSAVATGMTYYHRKGMWLEYPNLLNPFWRATLVAADIDDTSRADMNAVLSRSTEAWQSGVYDALLSSGYRGLH
jgi:hypothetical protein